MLAKLKGFIRNKWLCVPWKGVEVPEAEQMTEEIVEKRQRKPSLEVNRQK